MLVKTLENNGKNISSNIVQLNLEQNNFYINIWSKYMQRKEIFDNFVIILPDKTEN